MLILYYHPFPSYLPAKILHALLFITSYACYLFRPFYNSFDLHNNIWRRVQIMNLLIMQFSSPSYCLPLLGPNILLSTFSSSTLSRCSSFNENYQVSQNKTTNSVALVRKRTIPTERPPLGGEVSANFSE
jgi:hypothetical protein